MFGTSCKCKDVFDSLNFVQHTYDNVDHTVQIVRGQQSENWNWPLQPVDIPTDDYSWLIQANTNN